MKIKDIEKQLKNEIEAHSPSFETVLSKCKENEHTEGLIKEKCLVPATAGVPTRLQASRSILRYALPAILVAVLAIIVIFICLPPKANELTGGYFVIDINPSLEISYDKDGKVLAVTALNEDAEVLLYKLELNGKSYTEAIGLIVDNCVTLGYLSPQRQDNAILTTAISEQGVKDEKMTEKIKEVFSDTLTQKNVQGEVLTGVQDEELNSEAEKYGIDGQKLSLIQKYIEVGGEIEEGQYSEISIRELYYSICQKEKDVKNERIDNLKNEASKLETELNDKIILGLDGLKDIMPEDSEFKSQLEALIENANNDGAGSHIEDLLEMLDGIENSELGSMLFDFVSDLKTELETKNEEIKKANDELKELNKTVEEKKNDRLNSEENKNWQDKPEQKPENIGGEHPNENDENKPGISEDAHLNQNSEAHFPKGDEPLPPNNDDENKPTIEENSPIEERPTIEEQPPMEGRPPIDEHKPDKFKD